MVNIVETRYFKNASITNNGLTCNDLGTAQTGTFATEYHSAAGYLYYRLGIRVWKRSSGGTETEITSGTPVAIIETYDNPPTQYYSNTWACPQTELASGDSIVVRVYYSFDLGTPSWNPLSNLWQTEDLNQPYLKSATWTVVYKVSCNYTGSITEGWFNWGISTSNSRIENFTYGDLSVTTTRTISQNATLKAVGRTQTLSQNAVLKVSGQTQTLSQNAAIMASGRTQTLSQNAGIAALGQTQTLSQNAAVLAQSRALDQNAHIKSSGETQTLSQNASILSPERTISQNAHIVAVGQTQALTQNAHVVLVGQTRTISQDACLKQTATKTISQDATIQAVSQTLEQDAHLKATITQAISQDGRVIALGQTQTLDEDAHIKASGQTRGIAQDAHLKAVGRTQTCSQDARIIAPGQTQTIEQNAHVKISGQTRTISQDARVIAPGQTQTCLQNAWIKASGQIQNLSQDASLWAAGQTAALVQNASIDALTDETWIDSFALPHVLTFRIIYDATMVDKKVQNGILPRRKMIGKRGRTVEVAGWTKQQSDIDTMRAFEDGTTRTFYHPSGGFQVLVRDFQSSSAVDRWNRRIYQVTVVEQEA